MSILPEAVPPLHLFSRRGRATTSAAHTPHGYAQASQSHDDVVPGHMDGAVGPREAHMDFEKYTERARGFIQSAQSLALREGHQQFAPEHILKVLLDDPEGLAAGLIDRSGGRSREG